MSKLQKISPINEAKKKMTFFNSLKVLQWDRKVLQWELKECNPTSIECSLYVKSIVKKN